MRNGLAAVRCPGPVATVALSCRVHVAGPFSWERAALRGTWHRPDYYGQGDACGSEQIPSTVLSLAGIRSAPCLDVPLSGAEPADYPDRLSAAAVLSYLGADLRSSATTPGRVARLDGDGRGRAADEDSDSSDEPECAGLSSSVSTAAAATLDIANDPQTSPSYGLVGMVASGTIQASAEAVASIQSCGCCRERTLGMGVSSSGANAACTREVTLRISPPWTGQRLRGTLEVSGSFNVSLQPGQSFFQTISATSAAIVVRWRG